MSDRNKLLPLAKASRKHEKTTNNHPATIRRWADAGLVRDGKRFTLAVEFIGGRLFTSLAAIDEFLVAINAKPGETLAPRSLAQRNKASERAEAELIHRGA
ncbi:DUF1580 domain-containing protein [Gemmata sp. G18]|uniref:DUF1580 domain-containing protein n=1 Tax=Gemmata palustris TaxID=2822762 RepID=A0ABS5BML2_9BACT|nr:DUF1580 domain-containing protein [Gemmata palustris]MBP3954900.1 DUF1580 domain-containing protein [Gemmata palustris]